MSLIYLVCVEITTLDSRQCTENLWGIAKSWVAAHPTYSMAGVLKLIHEGLDKATPELCSNLVQRVRRTVDEYLLLDLKKYGPDGETPVEVCARKHSGCPYQEFSRSSKGGQADDARRRPLRKCSGPCGLAFHQECLKSREWDAAEFQRHWPETGTGCWCGCKEAEEEEVQRLEVEGGASTDEEEDGASTDEEVQPTQTELDTQLGQQPFVTRKRVHRPGGASKQVGRI